MRPSVQGSVIRQTDQRKQLLCPSCCKGLSAFGRDSTVPKQLQRLSPDIASHERILMKQKGDSTHPGIQSHRPVFSALPLFPKLLPPCGKSSQPLLNLRKGLALLPDVLLNEPRSGAAVWLSNTQVITHPRQTELNLIRCDSGEDVASCDTAGYQVKAEIKQGRITQRLATRNGFSTCALHPFKRLIERSSLPRCLCLCQHKRIGSLLDPSMELDVLECSFVIRQCKHSPFPPCLMLLTHPVADLGIQRTGSTRPPQSLLAEHASSLMKQLEWDHSIACSGTPAQ